MSQELRELQSCSLNAPTTSEASGRCRILVAGDDAVARLGLIVCLAPIPEVQICGQATNPRETVRLAKRTRPDLVILGMNSRAISGVETVRRIRNALPRTEVLVVTLHDSPEVARITLRSGARGFLSRSDPPEELIAAMHEVRKRRLHLTRLVASKLEGETERIAELDASPDPSLTAQEIASVLARSEMKLQADQSLPGRRPFVRLRDQHRILKAEWHHYWRVDRKRKSDLIIIVLGSIFGFTVLIALMVYISSVSQH
jgi:DNA-binding NarL/FixJ family response regulator